MRKLQRVLNPWSVAGIVVPLLLWEIGAHVIQATYPLGSTLFPTLEHIFLVALPEFATFNISAAQGFGGASSYPVALEVLAVQSSATLLRVILGVGVGLLLGIGAGLVMGWSKTIRELLFPIVQFLRTIPYLALVVLFMLWFGGAPVGPVIYVSFTLAMVMIVVTLEAIRNVPPVYRQYAQTMGATDFQVYRTVVVPAIIPGLVGAVRVALGSAWAVVLAAEYLSVQSGLGRLLILSEMFFKTGRMVVVVLLFMIFSAVLNYLFLLIARRLTRWQPAG